MIKEYKYNDKTQLTKNINVSELKCKGSGHTHNTKVDTTHVNNIQAFMDKNGYNKVVFSCGYRCSSHNKSVEGASNSQHLYGTATDSKFYKDGKVVSAKEICCKAQDFGFKGIGLIDDYYVHLDNRSSGTYRGDERKGYSNNVPNGDFYAYFGIKKVTTYTGTFPKLPSRGYFKKGDKGTEVKNLQKFLNWALDLKLGVDGIIGNKTINAVKEFQKITGIKVDGLFGKDCLAKAKTFTK